MPARTTLPLAATHPIDRFRISQGLAAAGLPENYNRREVTRQEADQFVKGGFDRLLRAAASSGRTDALESEDVSALPRKLTLRQLAFAVTGRDVAATATKTCHSVVAACDVVARQVTDMNARVWSDHGEARTFFDASITAARGLRELSATGGFALASDDAIAALKRGLESLNDLFQRVARLNLIDVGNYTGENEGGASSFEDLLFLSYKLTGRKWSLEASFCTSSERDHAGPPLTWKSPPTP